MNGSNSPSSVTPPNPGLPPFRITEASLAGFGVYEAPTQFLFPEGAGIFWGSNERGKTTLIWGITSVWFGLPGSSDPARVGTARFRSLSEPEEFWGEVVWEQEGQRFRLRRDFGTHRVLLKDETDDLPRILYNGEHNPQGRSSAGSEFPRVLKDILGIADLELFLETFSVAQRLPDPSAVGEELQHLISGSRTGKVTDVLASLFTQIKDLTKATGDLGVTRPGTSRPTNQREFGRIESLEARLTKARLELKDGRSVLETLNKSAEGFQATQETLNQVRQAIRDRKGRLASVERWLEANEDRERRAYRLSSLQSAKDDLAEADLERRDLERALAEEFSDYAVAPAELPSLLEELEDADEAVTRARQAVEEATSKRASREAELSALDTRLNEEFEDVRGRTDWVDVYERLTTAKSRAEGRILEMDRLDTEIADLEDQLETSAALEGHPVGALRANAEMLLQTAERVRAIDTRVGEIEDQIEERSFLQSADNVKALREKVNLEAELRECSVRLREQKAAVTIAAERLREAEARIEDEWMEAEEKLLDLRPSKTMPSVRFEPVRPLTTLLASAALTIGLIFGLGAPWWAGLLAGIAVALGIRVLNRALGRAPVHTQSVSTSQQTRAYRSRQRAGRVASDGTATPADAASATAESPASASPTGATGPAAPADPARSAAPTAPAVPATEDPLTPEMARKQLAEAEDELERLRREERQIETRLESLQHSLGPYATTTQSELAKMEERWRLLDQQIEALKWEKLNLLEDRFGTGDESWVEIPVVETQEHLEKLLLLPDSPDDSCTVGELVDWLAALTDRDWDEFLELERARQRLSSELERLRDRRDRVSKDTSADEAVTELEVRLAPFTLETDPDQLAERTATCQELETRVRTLREQLRDDSADPNKVATAESAREEAWDRLVAVWPVERPGADSPVSLAEWARRHREAERPAREARQRHDWLEESAEQVLRSALVESRTDLRTQIEEQQAALTTALREVESLESAEGMFAALHGVADAQERGRRIQAIQQAERADLENDRVREEELEESVRQMLKDQASLEGRDTPNLASLELRIQEMNDDLARARRERDSLVLAFQWMEEAAESFQENHREALESAVQSYFHILTGEATRRICLNERFELEIWDAEGHRLAIEQLSQGAKDQLLLASRFAVADLLSSAVPLPFFFDDPFVHFDETRLEATRKALQKLSSRRQWILLTHRRDLVEWAEPIFSQPLDTFTREASGQAAG